MYWSNSKKISNLLPFSQCWENGNFFTAHQPSNTRTSAVMHPHIKWCASAQQLMCGLRYYIFQQFLLYLLETSIICLKDFCYTFQVLLLYLSKTIPISFEDYPYIFWRLSLYTSTSSPISSCIRKCFSVSLVFPTSIFPHLWFLVNFPRFLCIFHP